MTSGSRGKKLLDRVLQKRCKNVRFDDLRTLLEAYGFVRDRISSSHHIYTHPCYRGIVTLQKPHHQPEVPQPFCRQALTAIQEIIELENEGDDRDEW